MPLAAAAAAATVMWRWKWKPRRIAWRQSLQRIKRSVREKLTLSHRKIPGSSNVQIAAILLENWEDAAIAAHNINFRAAVIVKRFNLEIYHEKELHENPAVRKRPLDDDGRNPFLTYSIDGRGHRPKRHQRHIEETENPRRDF